VHGNQWYIRPDGTVFVDLQQGEKDAIQAEADERCNQIMTIAERRSEHLRTKH